MRIITLTLSPAFDVHCTCNDFAPYRESLATVTSRDAGGKGVNISRALTENKIENLAIVVLGRENAEDFEVALRKYGITYLPIYRDGRVRENITLHTEGKEETRISFSGFSADDALLDELLAIVLREKGDEDTIVTLTGRIPDGISMQTTKSFLKRLKEMRCKLVIDSKSFSKEDIFDVKPWLIKPNEEELPLYVEQTERIELAAQMLHAQGIENVLLSRGADGAILSASDGIFSAKPPRISARSTIGAGDSMIAGFIAAYTSNKSSVDCLKSAIAYGSAACLTEGTQPPRREDVLKINQNVLLND